MGRAQTQGRSEPFPRSPELLIGVLGPGGVTAMSNSPRRQRDSGVAKGAGIPEQKEECPFRPLPSVLTHQTHLPTGRPRPSSQNTPSPPGFHSVFLLNKLRVGWMHILLKKLFNSAFFLDCGKGLGQNNEKEMINSLNLCFWNSNSKYLST